MGVARLMERRIFPGRRRFLAVVQHVVMVRVAAHAHRHELEQCRAVSAAGALRRPRERRGDRLGIRSIDGDARHAVTGRLVGKHARRRVLVHRRRQRRLVVLQTEHGRQLPHRAEIDRLVPFAQRRSALADERERDASGALAPEAHGQPGDVERADRERRGRGQHTPGPIPRVQVFARHRRSGLPHLRREDLPHGVLVVPHGERNADVADDRRHDVAAPAAILPSPGRPAPQPDAAGVHRFLPERAEPLALERPLAPPDLAAHEELLQSRVDGSRDHHAAQDLAALIGRERGADGLAGEKPVARLDDLGARLLQPFDRRYAGRRLVDPVRCVQCVVETRCQLAAKRRAQGLEGGRGTRDPALTPP